MSDASTAMEFVGLIGGFTISLSLIPQLYHTIKTRETKDISLVWQLTYIIGLSLTLSYAIFENLWAVYAPGLFELFCILILTGIKLYYDYYKPWRFGPEIIETKVNDEESCKCKTDENSMISKSTESLDNTIGMRLYKVPKKNAVFCDNCQIEIEAPVEPRRYQSQKKVHHLDGQNLGASMPDFEIHRVVDKRQSVHVVSSDPLFSVNSPPNV